jgi:hypothetical protein
VIDAQQQHVTKIQQQKKIGDKVFISFKDPIESSTYCQRNTMNYE